MYQDYKDLLSAFNAHGVRYLVVGAYAVIFHAQPRFTKDIDLFIQADPANAQATYTAFAAVGAVGPYPMLRCAPTPGLNSSFPSVRAAESISAGSNRRKGGVWLRLLAKRPTLTIPIN